MKKILIISFIILWFSNSWICAYFYPNFKTDYIEWGKFVSLRETIYEVMFFILLVCSIFRPSKVTRALIFSTSVIVVLSIVDKITGVTSYALSDIIVVAFSVFIGLFYYKIGYKWMKG